MKNKNCNLCEHELVNDTCDNPFCEKYHKNINETNYILCDVTDKIYYSTKDIIVAKEKAKKFSSAYTKKIFVYRLIYSCETTPIQEIEY